MRAGTKSFSAKSSELEKLQDLVATLETKVSTLEGQLTDTQKKLDEVNENFITRIKAIRARSKTALSVAISAADSFLSTSKIGTTALATALPDAQTEISSPTTDTDKAIKASAALCKVAAANLTVAICDVSGTDFTPDLNRPAVQDAVRLQQKTLNAALDFAKSKGKGLEALIPSDLDNQIEAQQKIFDNPSTNQDQLAKSFQNLVALHSLKAVQEALDKVVTTEALVENIKAFIAPLENRLKESLKNTDAEGNTQMPGRINTAGETINNLRKELSEVAAAKYLQDLLKRAIDGQDVEDILAEYVMERPFESNPGIQLYENLLELVEHAGYELGEAEGQIPQRLFHGHDIAGSDLGERKANLRQLYLITLSLGKLAEEQASRIQKAKLDLGLVLNGALKTNTYDEDNLAAQEDADRAFEALLTKSKSEDSLPLERLENLQSIIKIRAAQIILAAALGEDLDTYNHAHGQALDRFREFVKENQLYENLAQQIQISGALSRLVLAINKSIGDELKVEAGDKGDICKVRTKIEGAISFWKEEIKNPIANENVIYAYQSIAEIHLANYQYSLVASSEDNIEYLRQVYEQAQQSFIDYLTKNGQKESVKKLEAELSNANKRATVFMAEGAKYKGAIEARVNAAASALKDALNKVDGQSVAQTETDAAKIAEAVLASGVLQELNNQIEDDVDTTTLHHEWRVGILQAQLDLDNARNTLMPGTVDDTVLEKHQQDLLEARKEQIDFLRRQTGKPVNAGSAAMTANISEFEKILSDFEQQIEIYNQAKKARAQAAENQLFMDVVDDGLDDLKEELRKKRALRSFKEADFDVAIGVLDSSMSGFSPDEIDDLGRWLELNELTLYNHLIEKKPESSLNEIVNSIVIKLSSDKTKSPELEKKLAHYEELAEKLLNGQIPTQLYIDCFSKLEKIVLESQTALGSEDPDRVKHKAQITTIQNLQNQFRDIQNPVWDLDFMEILKDIDADSDALFAEDDFGSKHSGESGSKPEFKLSENTKVSADELKALYKARNEYNQYLSANGSKSKNLKLHQGEYLKFLRDYFKAQIAEENENGFKFGTLAEADANGATADPQNPTSQVLKAVRDSLVEKFEAAQEALGGQAGDLQDLGDNPTYEEILAVSEKIESLTVGVDDVKTLKAAKEFFEAVVEYDQVQLMKDFGANHGLSERVCKDNIKRWQRAQGRYYGNPEVVGLGAELKDTLKNCYKKVCDLILGGPYLSQAEEDPDISNPEECLEKFKASAINPELSFRHRFSAAGKALNLAKKLFDEAPLDQREKFRGEFNQAKDIYPKLKAEWVAHKEQRNPGLFKDKGIDATTQSKDEFGVEKEEGDKGIGELEKELREKQARIAELEELLAAQSPDPKTAGQSASTDDPAKNAEISRLQAELEKRKEETDRLQAELNTAELAKKAEELDKLSPNSGSKTTTKPQELKNEGKDPGKTAPLKSAAQLRKGNDKFEPYRAYTLEEYENILELMRLQGDANLEGAFEPVITKVQTNAFDVVDSQGKVVEKRKAEFVYKMAYYDQTDGVVRDIFVPQDKVQALMESTQVEIDKAGTDNVKKEEAHNLAIAELETLSKTFKTELSANAGAIPEKLKEDYTKSGSALEVAKELTKSGKKKAKVSFATIDGLSEEDLAPYSSVKYYSLSYQEKGGKPYPITYGKKYEYKLETSIDKKGNPRARVIRVDNSVNPPAYIPITDYRCNLVKGGLGKMSDDEFKTVYNQLRNPADVVDVVSTHLDRNKDISHQQTIRFEGLGKLRAVGKNSQLPVLAGGGPKAKIDPKNGFVVVTFSGITSDAELAQAMEDLLEDLPKATEKMKKGERPPLRIIFNGCQITSLDVLAQFYKYRVIDVDCRNCHILQDVSGLKECKADLHTFSVQNSKNVDLRPLSELRASESDKRNLGLLRVTVDQEKLQELQNMNARHPEPDRAGNPVESHSFSPVILFGTPKGGHQSLRPVGFEAIKQSAAREKTRVSRRLKDEQTVQIKEEAIKNGNDLDFGQSQTAESVLHIAMDLTPENWKTYLAPQTVLDLGVKRRDFFPKENSKLIAATEKLLIGDKASGEAPEDYEARRAGAAATIKHLAIQLNEKLVEVEVEKRIDLKNPRADKKKIENDAIFKQKVLIANFQQEVVRQLQLGPDRNQELQHSLLVKLETQSPNCKQALAIMENILRLQDPDKIQEAFDRNIGIFHAAFADVRKTHPREPEFQSSVIDNLRLIVQKAKLCQDNDGNRRVGAFDQKGTLYDVHENIRTRFCSVLNGQAVDKELENLNARFADNSTVVANTMLDLSKLPYIKALNVFDRSNPDKYAELRKNVTGLRFAGCQQLTKDLLDDLKRFPHLSYIDFRGSNISDQAVQDLHEMFDRKNMKVEIVGHDGMVAPKAPKKVVESPTASPLSTSRSMSNGASSA